MVFWGCGFSFFGLRCFYWIGFVGRADWNSGHKAGALRQRESSLAQDF